MRDWNLIGPLNKLIWLHEYNVEEINPIVSENLGSVLDQALRHMVLEQPHRRGMACCVSIFVVGLLCIVILLFAVIMA
jgi:hypothetical protein